MKVSKSEYLKNLSEFCGDLKNRYEWLFNGLWERYSPSAVNNRDFAEILAIIGNSENLLDLLRSKLDAMSRKERRENGR